MKVNVVRNNLTVVAGLALGVVVALAFAIVIRYVPSSVFRSDLWLAVMFVLSLPLGAVAVQLGRWVASATRGSESFATVPVCAGVGLFDGTAMTFWPEVYGQNGTALRAVAALIIWGVTCNFVAAWIASQRDTASSN